MTSWSTSHIHQIRHKEIGLRHPRIGLGMSAFQTVQSASLTSPTEMIHQIKEAHLQVGALSHWGESLTRQQEGAEHERHHHPSLVSNRHTNKDLKEVIVQALSPRGRKESTKIED